MFGRKGMEQGNFPSNLSRMILIISIVVLFIVSCGVTCLAETRCGSSTVRGDLCSGVYVSCRDNTHGIPSGESTAYEIQVQNSVYRTTDVSLRLEGVPEFWDAELNRTDFTLGSGEEINVTFSVFSPENASAGSLAVITITGTYNIEGDDYDHGVWPERTATDIIGPDLIVVSTGIDVSHENPVEGQRVGLTAKIHNIGDVRAVNIPVRFLVDGDQIGWVCILDELAPAKSGFVFGNWTARAGNHTITVTVDFEDGIDEYSESNNNASITISVGEKPVQRNLTAPLSLILCIPILAVGRVIMGDRSRTP